jgi:hypothetical protein
MRARIEDFFFGEILYNLLGEVNVIFVKFEWGGYSKRLSGQCPGEQKGGGLGRELLGCQSN